MILNMRLQIIMRILDPSGMFIAPATKWYDDELPYVGCNFMVVFSRLHHLTADAVVSLLRVKHITGLAKSGEKKGNERKHHEHKIPGKLYVAPTFLTLAPSSFVKPLEKRSRAGAISPIFELYSSSAATRMFVIVRICWFSVTPCRSFP
jgi:hypothetical protein